MDFMALADFLFPDVTGALQDLEKEYPPRTLPEGAKVTRMAPSPTGFLHLGNLYGALADERLAHQSSGVFFLRIEDTDQKREVPGGVETILDVFKTYRLPFDEGATLEGDNGAYGPYRQRQRAGIYHICAKWLVQQGKAYPCFLTEEELAAMREQQAAAKENFGCYGKYAVCRDLSFEEISRRVNAGEAYVLRFRSEGSPAVRVKVSDLVRGTLEFPENDQDVVLLKSDGIPTYHFAHVVDDHFMQVSIVLRGEEWLATLPIHVQLFSAMGWRLPKYLHTAQLMKMDGGSKRKLSKRKDPELALDYYKQAGYTVGVLKEYLMLLLNSNFEEWRTANPDKPLEDFPFSVKKMGVSGALFDLDKLNDMSRTYISRLTAGQVYEELHTWALAFDPDFAALLARDKAYTLSLLSIGRGGKKPRKDITTWEDAKAYIGFFFDELFTPDYTIPDNVSSVIAKDILNAYGDIYDPADDATLWFDKIQELADRVGYASDMKAFKLNPDGYAGHVGDVSMVLRVAVAGRQNSPDMREIMAILGKEKVEQRLRRAAEAI